LELRLGRAQRRWCCLQGELHLEPGLLRRDRVVGEHLLLALIGRNTQRLAEEHLLLGRSTGSATKISTTEQFALRIGRSLRIESRTAKHVSGLPAGHITTRGCIPPAGGRGRAERTEATAQQEARTEGNKGFFAIPLDHQRGEGGDVRFIQLRTQFWIEYDTVSDLGNGLGRAFESTSTNTSGNALAQRASGHAVHDGAQRGREPTGNDSRAYGLDAGLKQRGHDDVRLDIWISRIETILFRSLPRGLEFHREDRGRYTDQSTGGSAEWAKRGTSGGTRQTCTNGHPNCGCRLDGGRADLAKETLLPRDSRRPSAFSIRDTNRFACLHKRTADTLGTQHLEATSRAPNQPLTHVARADTEVAHEATALGDTPYIAVELCGADLPPVSADRCWCLLS
jgi:hypothetical protein